MKFILLLKCGVYLKISLPRSETKFLLLGRTELAGLGGRNSPQTPLPLFLFSNGTGTEVGGQKFLPPNPLPFCPPAWALPPKLFGGRIFRRTSNWVATEFRFQKLFPDFYLFQMQHLNAVGINFTKHWHTCFASHGSFLSFLGIF